MNNEDIESLARYLRRSEKKLETLIKEWFEQNPHTPYVVGLTDEQIAHVSKWIFPPAVDRFKEWLTTQTFVQPPPLTPNWDDAPQWANWLAQDSTGLWKWFERQPVNSNNNYGSRIGLDKWIRVCGRFAYCTDGSNWANSLQQRPTTTPRITVGQLWENNVGVYEIIAVNDNQVVRKDTSGGFMINHIDDFLTTYTLCSD